jgi:hypothetical protein
MDGLFRMFSAPEHFPAGRNRPAGKCSRLKKLEPILFAKVVSTSCGIGSSEGLFVAKNSQLVAEIGCA